MLWARVRCSVTPTTGDLASASLTVRISNRVFWQRCSATNKSAIRGGFGVGYDELFYSLPAQSQRRSYPRAVTPQLLGAPARDQFPILPPTTPHCHRRRLCKRPSGYAESNVELLESFGPAADPFELHRSSSVTTAIARITLFVRARPTSAFSRRRRLTRLSRTVRHSISERARIRPGLQLAHARLNPNWGSRILWKPRERCI